MPETLDVLHWHGETFSLPPGAERLYCSPYCENQAFIYKDCVIGLQFHLETTSQTLQDLVAADYKYIEGMYYNKHVTVSCNTKYQLTIKSS